MAPSFRSVLLGTKQSEFHRYFILVLVLGVFTTTFAAYTLGLFPVSSGVIWIPFYAAIVGMIAGFWVSYSRRGLLFAWLVAYTALLGYHADQAFYGLSGRDITEQFAYFVRLDVLVVLAVEGVILGSIVFILAVLVRWGILFLNGTTPKVSNKGT